MQPKAVRRFTRITILVIIYALTLPGPAKAVDHIRGQVVDILTGQPIPNAYVICPLTEHVAQTDARGVFSVESKFIQRERNTPGGLTGLLSGGLIGGPLALFGVGSGSQKALDASPKPLLVIAQGYKLFYGNVSVLTGDVGKAMVVVHRIGLAPDIGDLESQVVAGIAGLASRGSQQPSQSGAEGTFSVSPLGYVTETTLEPVVLNKSKQTVDVVVRMDGPPDLLATYRAQVMFSTGETTKLSAQKADKGALTTTYKASTKLSVKPGIVEAKVGGAFVIRSFERTRGFMELFEGGLITSFLANVVRAVGNTGADYAASVVAGNIVARNFYLALAPDLAEPDLQAWQRGLASLTTPETADEKLTGIPPSPAREALSTITQYVLAGDNLVKLRDWVRVAETALGDPALAASRGLIARDVAVACSVLARQSGLPEDREAAIKAIATAASAFSSYGPGLRQLADLAYALEDYSLAEGIYRRSASRLGDADREMGDPTAYTSYGPSSTLDTIVNWFNPNDLVRTLIGGPIGNERKVYSRRSAQLMAEACKRLAKAQKSNRDKDWLDAARVLNETGDVAGAIRAVQRANSIKETADGLNFLGTLYSRLPASDANTEAELEAYRRASELDSKDPIILSNLARTYWQMKQYDEAAKVFERVRPPRDEAAMAMAKASVMAWKSAGDDPEANEIAALLLVLENAEQLDRDATQPIAVKAAEVAAAANRGWAHWALYRLTQRPEHLDHAIAAMPQEPLFCAERMEDRLMAGDLAGAEEWAVKARSLRRQRLLIPKGLPSQARKTLVDEYRERLLHLADSLQNYSKLLARRK